MGNNVQVQEYGEMLRKRFILNAACVPADALYPLPASMDLDAAVSLPNFQLAQALLFGCGSAVPVGHRFSPVFYLIPSPRA